MHETTNRVRMRLSCEVSVGERRHSGLVLNVSPGGLFVQTHAKPTSGDAVRVGLHVPGCAEAMTLDATVVWKRVVPASLIRVAQGGVGLRLLNPPEGYYQFLAAAARFPESRGRPASFKVRVSRGQRSRIVSVAAASETRAREIALESAGAGWKVIGSERC